MEISHSSNVNSYINDYQVDNSTVIFILFFATLPYFEPLWISLYGTMLYQISLLGYTEINETNAPEPS